MKKTLTVAAVRNGTVIDHIPSGVALTILHFLQAPKTGSFTVGLHLSSKKIGKKDLIKLHDRTLSFKEEAKIAIFAPKATINIIVHYELTEKYSPLVPKEVVGIFSCPNKRCITKQEKIASHFFVDSNRMDHPLTCKYCKKTFYRQELQNIWL